MFEEQNLLIVATSGRMLAQKAKQAGYRPFVIDCFADIDTLESAIDCEKVASLSKDYVKNAFWQLKKRYSINQAIIGSGLERHLGCYEFLDNNVKLLANKFDSFKAVQNHVDFFATLKQYDIRHPEISIQPPAIDQNWLFKPFFGEGGIGVKKYQLGYPHEEPGFWQKFQPGIPMSILFLADGQQFYVCGYQTQWTTSQADLGYVFSGVMTQPEVSYKIQQQVEKWVGQLVDIYHLVGLNTLDFIANHETCFFLEMNARPSASIQLYNESLLKMHIQMCKGQLFDWQNDDDGCPYRGYKILYAASDCEMTHEIQWPEWCVDIPPRSTLISQFEPICSIIAREKSEYALNKTLQKRQQTILNLMKAG